MDTNSWYLLFCFRLPLPEQLRSHRVMWYYVSNITLPNSCSINFDPLKEHFSIHNNSFMCFPSDRLFSPFSSCTTRSSITYGSCGDNWSSPDGSGSRYSIIQAIFGSFVYSELWQASMEFRQWLQLVEPLKRNILRSRVCDGPYHTKWIGFVIISLFQAYSQDHGTCANWQHFSYANMRPFPYLFNRDGTKHWRAVISVELSRSSP